MKRIFTIALILVLQNITSIANANEFTQNNSGHNNVNTVSNPIDSNYVLSFIKIGQTNAFYTNVSSYNTNTLLASDIYGNLSMSFDDGKNWKQVPNSPSTMKFAILYNRSVAKMAQGTKVYAIVYQNKSVAVTDNPGSNESWTTIYKISDSSNRFIDSTAVSNDGILYVIDVDNYTLNNAIVHMSLNGGKSWTNLGNTLSYTTPDFYDHAVISANNAGPLVYFHHKLYVFSGSPSNKWVSYESISSVGSMASAESSTYITTIPGVLYQYVSYNNSLDLLSTIPQNGSYSSITSDGSNLFLRTGENEYSIFYETLVDN